MKTTIKNQHGKYIDKHHEEIIHLADKCYASMVIDGKKVSIQSDEVVDDVRVIVVEVDGI